MNYLLAIEMILNGIIYIKYIWNKMKTFLLMNSENLYLDNDGSMTFEIGII